MGQPMDTSTNLDLIEQWACTPFGFFPEYLAIPNFLKN
jgi:hypothetical protein